MKIHGRVDNGQFSNLRFLFDCFRKFEGKQINVLITKRKQTRTLPQNSYLWGVVYETIASYVGDTPEGIHDALGQEFRRYQDDKGLWRIKSTTEMSTEEFSDYVEQVKAWASSFLNLYIPDPDER